MNLPVINFEGIDGAGKSFALEHLRRKYEEAGIPVTVVESISVKEFINAHNPRWYDLSSDTARFIQYLAYEVNNYYKNIKPNIGKSVVLIDRYFPSCYAYNRLYPNPDMEFQKMMYNALSVFVTEFYRPDVTFVFDAPNEIIESRFKEFRQHEGSVDLKFTQQIRDGYKNFRDSYGHLWNMVSIDGSKDITQIINDMTAVIDSLKREVTTT